MGRMSDTPANVSTERRIILAAEKEFLEKGYDGARTTSIAEAAGVTHAMLHYYFRSKDNLFEMVISEKLHLLKQIMLGSIMDSKASLFDRIADAIRVHLDFLAANPQLPRFMISILASGGIRRELIQEQMGSFGTEVVSKLQAEIDDYAARGLCLPVDARMLMLDIVSLNIFSFVATPLIDRVLGDFTIDSQFIELRKRNNVDTILKKLKP